MMLSSLNIACALTYPKVKTKAQKNELAARKSIGGKDMRDAKYERSDHDSQWLSREWFVRLQEKPAKPQLFHNGIREDEDQDQRECFPRQKAQGVG